MPDTSLVHLFSEIAPRFGLSRAAGQCFAAIWRAAQAPSADDLVAQLGLARSNISVAVRELRDAGLVRAARSPGSRKDYFVADPDPWAIVRVLMALRERRDLAPLLDELRQMDQSDARVTALRDVVDKTGQWLAAYSTLPVDDLPRRMETPGKKKKKKS